MLAKLPQHGWNNQCCEDGDVEEISPLNMPLCFHSNNRKFKNECPTYIPTYVKIVRCYGIKLQFSTMFN